MILLNLNRILTLIGIDEERAEVAQEFVHYVLPGLFLEIMYEQTFRYMTAMKRLYLPMCV